MALNIDQISGPPEIDEPNNVRTERMVRGVSLAYRNCPGNANDTVAGPRCQAVVQKGPLVGVSDVVRVQWCADTLYGLRLLAK